MAKTEQLTIPAYAKKINRERTTVFRAVQKEQLHLLPGVIKIIKVGRYRLLEIAS